jgi:hypothetical protein
MGMYYITPAKALFIECSCLGLYRGLERALVLAVMYLGEYSLEMEVEGLE